ncbi:bifunctional 3'-5' exonuclease/DNA polymerase [Arthrobacter sp. KK5.5]|uniref:bifunctional 3'-5' exonuclease/DNA polymerase n=1 Tax=Arthrobacter sp. KK5.5 TaxID=3373084 RepID=UPI003EE7DCF7
MPRYALLATHSTGQPAPEAGAATAVVQFVDAQAEPEGPAILVFRDQLPAVVADIEARGVRWVWESTVDWYPRLLAAGSRVERAHDLTLCRNIIRHSTSTLDTGYVRALRREAAPATGAEPPQALLPPRPPENQGTLFEEPKAAGGSAETLAQEFADQLAAVPRSLRGRRLQLLLAAESAGALAASEMQHHGIPWRRDIHEALLLEALGPRTAPGIRPARLEDAARELRTSLNAPALNPDSSQELLRALHRAGINAKSTSQWELQEFSHPALDPLARYKKLSRLLTANGWTWLDAWVADGRFRPEYVVGGVVTGRWSSRGGGAMQIPHTVRDAARADPCHRLVVADAAQLEPRILAVLANDDALADAARGRDLYQGIADLGFGGDRASAKVAMLGAMYGATTGEAGRLMPQLTRTFPKAVEVVEHAARVGEAGGTVCTFLGRCSPPASEAWLAAQRTSDAEEQRRADQMARTRGRFTRNFVVQGTAAEWALCWLGELRRRLHAERLSGRDTGGLAFFLHDEVVLHVPTGRAEAAAGIAQDAATAAAELMFGRTPVEFPVGVAVVESYANAK